MTKKTAKKTTKKTTKAVAKADDFLVQGKVGAAELAALADFDSAALEGVELDVADNADLYKNDIVIPKIWLIQSMSELRKDKKADEGDFVDSKSEEILPISSQDGEEYIPIVVLKTFKRWQTFKLVEEKGKVKKEFISSEIMELGKNEKLLYEDTLEGEKIVRRQVISAYVLLGRDVQAGLKKVYCIDFAATSKEAGRNMISDIKVLNTPKKNARTGVIERRGLPSWVAWFKLGRFEKKEEHDYFVKTMKTGGVLPQETFGFLRDAYDEVTALIAENAIEMDDRDLNDEAKEKIKDNSNVVDSAGNAEAKV